MSTNYPDFSFASTPHIYFGPGKRKLLPSIVKGYGSRVLVVTGAHSFRSSPHWGELMKEFDTLSIEHYSLLVSGEPSPSIVDNAVHSYKDRNIDVVLSIGGGSVVDSGKAISAMITQDTPVKEYLEGVGTGEKPPGDKIPFIAVPTTSGTGSETTKNAVLSHIGEGGFKKSLRHDNYVPNVAVIDPELTLTCPTDVTASVSMDNLTQLIESYVSLRATPMTDGLAWSGLEAVRDNLLTVCTDNPKSLDARTAMAYGAMISGITLANAGLGIVHGLASSVGGYYPIPHGVVCGTLLSAATQVTIRELRAMGDVGVPYLEKYADIGTLFTGNDTESTDASCDHLVEHLDGLTDTLSLPRLGEYGVRERDIDAIVKITGNKDNPVSLTPDQIHEILSMRL